MRTETNDSPYSSRSQRDNAHWTTRRAYQLILALIFSPNANKSRNLEYFKVRKNGNVFIFFKIYIKNCDLEPHCQPTQRNWAHFAPICSKMSTTFCWAMQPKREPLWLHRSPRRPLRPGWKLWITSRHLAPFPSWMPTSLAACASHSSPHSTYK